MNKLSYIIMICVTGLISSCSNHKEIPPEVLEKIIEETVLSNSIVNNISEIRDSAENNVDYYTPILEKYQYTIHDLDYTIGKMVSRKSRVLNSVIQRAKNNIAYKKEHVSHIYNMYKDMQNTIDTKQQDTLINIDSTRYTLKKNSDIDKTILNIPLNSYGRYEVEISYRAKTNANNKSYYANFSLRDSLIDSRIGNKRTQRYYIPIRKDDIDNVGNAIKFKFAITPENDYNYLNINLFSMSRLDNYLMQSNKDRPTKNPNIEIINILIIRKSEYMQAINKMIESYSGVSLLKDFVTEPTQALVTPYLPADSADIDFMPKYNIYEYKPIIKYISPSAIDFVAPVKKVAIPSNLMPMAAPNIKN